MATVYQLQRKIEVAKAMDVPYLLLNLRFAFWTVIRDTYDRGDLVGTRELIEKLSQ